MKRSPIKRKTRLNPVNRKRRQSEFARCYGSKERVAFVKSLMCAVHAGGVCTPEIHNAHTENGGRGRKGGYAAIAPLCSYHHPQYDEHRGMFANPAIREAVKEVAASTQTAWLAWSAYQESQPVEPA